MAEELVSAVLEVARRHVAAPAELDELTPIALDSLEVVAFVVDLETRFGIRFPSELVKRETFATGGAVADAIRTLRP